jgi:hypothetical protein
MYRLTLLTRQVRRQNPVFLDFFVCFVAFVV